MFIRLLENTLDGVDLTTKDTVPLSKKVKKKIIHFKLEDQNLRFFEEEFDLRRIPEKNYQVLQTQEMIVLRFDSTNILLLQSFNTNILVLNEDGEIVPKPILDLEEGDMVLRYDPNVGEDDPYLIDEISSITRTPLLEDDFQMVEDEEDELKKGFHQYILGTGQNTGVIINELFLV